MALKTKPREEADNIRLELAERSFYRFSLLAAQINRAIGRAYVQRYGRPAHGWRVLTVLGNFGPLSATEITHRNTLETDKVTRIVDSLVEQGLVTRQQDSEDRRRVIVALTAKGKRIYVQIEQMIGEMEHEFLIVLSNQEREMLYDILDRLKQRGDQVFRTVSRWAT
ncbi:MarR family winged helix-turn-helix transcriptional regulator [Bradyrhizobium sp. NP1]|uniref:MarR family winged helix-turn-helix transcriptional regulator n=1 Tax=Bradyrhizobium sp. NP1 TaxID=3049772 RepID=UPI0025A5AA39|nr:MarR family winged helix-turn-helix transcriptional regulator [Bradyrhizobium sp. NP1]WJR75823.1 MarR family winged helix-turn-helix transcriptional regulator [Bradyrhizobium sp. NP1]